jgi:predicted neuraminidase
MSIHFLIVSYFGGRRTAVRFVGRMTIRGTMAFLILGLRVPAQTPEFVASPMPVPSCHASTVVELRDGRVMAAWFGGAGEGKPDVAIWGAVRENGRWNAPAVLVREPAIPTYNPVLFHSAAGVLWLYYKFGPNPSEWTAGRLSSGDEGRTWSAPEHLPAGIYGPIRAKPLVLDDGTIVSGTSVESYGSWACWIERSTDDGRTWTRHGPVTVAGTTPPRPGIDSGIIQPVVVPMGGRRLRFYARATADIGRICVAESPDGGVTWTSARSTDLPNPNAGIDVVRLKDGRFVMAYNHTSSGRTPLNLAVSSDGERWAMFHALETEPGEYSYPAMIQGRDGNLRITYTWRRKNIRYIEWPLRAIP